MSVKGLEKKKRKERETHNEASATGPPIDQGEEGEAQRTGE